IDCAFKTLPVLAPRPPASRSQPASPLLRASRENSAGQPSGWMNDPDPTSLSPGPFEPIRDYRSHVLSSSFPRIAAGHAHVVRLVGLGRRLGRCGRTAPRSLAEMGYAALRPLPGRDHGCFLAGLENQPLQGRAAGPDRA